jgi:hypothetical protein
LELPSFGIIVIVYNCYENNCLLLLITANFHSISISSQFQSLFKDIILPGIVLFYVWYIPIQRHLSYSRTYFLAYSYPKTYFLAYPIQRHLSWHIPIQRHLSWHIPIQRRISWHIPIQRHLSWHIPIQRHLSWHYLSHP